ncbi:MAG: secondary thiamine-phosphate synthase enzyme YjbQ [Calditrichia bacterium]
MKKIQIRTNQQVEFLDITSHVTSAIRESGCKEGLCIVFVPHTTAAITINENADPSVVRDMKKEINQIVPFDDGYTHMEGNSAAHIKSSLFGVSETIIIENNLPVLGTWQGIYFCEFDGPRNRTVYIKIISS